MTTLAFMGIEWHPMYHRYEVEARLAGPEGKVESKGAGETLAEALDAAFAGDFAPHRPDIDLDVVGEHVDAAIRDGWFWRAASWGDAWSVEVNDAYSGKWLRGFDEETFERCLEEAAGFVTGSPEILEEKRKGYEEPGWLDYWRHELANRQPWMG